MIDSYGLLGNTTLLRSGRVVLEGACDALDGEALERAYFGYDTPQEAPAR